MKDEALYRPPGEIERLGFAVLCERLGMADALRFVQQFDLGKGDYTRERERLFEKDTVESLYHEIEQRRKVREP
jgi:hypothetical protein